MRLAGIADGVVDQIALFAPLRHENGDAVAGFLRQRVGEQLLFLDPARQQDLPRTGLVVVELREEGASTSSGASDASALGK